MWFLVVLSLILSITSCAAALAVVWHARRSLRPGDLDQVPTDVLGLRQEVAALQQEVAGAMRHVAVVRYDAFGDMGGHLSWSVALCDDAGDGVLLTCVHGRSESRTYARSVTAWSCDQPLSEEESRALSQARG